MAVSYSTVVGRTVRMLREVREISSETMRDHMGMATVSGWSRVETGDTTMTVEHLRKVSSILQVSPAEILSQAEGIWNGLHPQGGS